ncbi:MAG: hypothetical protein M3540_11510, partial [Actinomycetota bacterium]|nr:hypothetical protein [Actinomycetota bacterium]
MSSLIRYRTPRPAQGTRVVQRSLLIGALEPQAGPETTPTPGGALAAGTGPSAKADAAQGGGPAAGLAPSARVAVAQG